jgi:hypothetical protein
MREAGLRVSSTLTDLANSAIAPRQTETGVAGLNNQLTLLFKLLAQTQGGPDCSEATASRHLMTVLSQLGQDEIEISSSCEDLNLHGKWLAEKLDDESKKNAKPAKLNSLLFTAQADPSSAAFAPGTVFHVTDTSSLEKFAGFKVEQLQRDCFSGKDPAVFEDFRARTKIVLVEITPACDFHQGNRRSAMLLGGIACPAELFKKANSKDACKRTPVFEDRFSTPVADMTLVLCSNYRLTLSHNAHPAWLTPWLRLRDIVMTDIRNWHASHAARVGYLQF